MSIYRVQGPDGRVHRFEGPEGASPAQVEAHAADFFRANPGAATGAASAPRFDLSKISTEDLVALKSGALSRVSTPGLLALKAAHVSAREELVALRRMAELEDKQKAAWEARVASERGKLQAAQMDEMPWYEKVGAGFGKAFMDTAHGIQQIAGNRDTQQVAEDRRLDAPLMDTGAGLAGNIVGNAAQTIALPGGTTLKGAAAYGALQSYLQPTVEGESRTLNAAVGGGAGLAGQGAAKAVGWAARGPASRLTQAQQYLASRAKDFGIELTPAQASGNSFLQTMDSVLGTMPATAGKQAERQASQSAQFTRAITRQMGQEADDLGEATMSAAKGRLSDEYRRIFDGVKVPAQDFGPRLALVRAEAQRALPGDKFRTVASRLDDLMAKAKKDGAVDGVAYQKWRSSLTSSDGDTLHYLKMARNAVDDAASVALGPDKMDDFIRANLQWKNMKTLQPLAEKSTTGQPSPALLLERVRSSYPDMAYGGAGDMGDLARIGKSFLREPIPNSGTPQRQLAQALLSGGVLGGGTGALAYGATGDPGAALRSGGMMLAGSVAIPKLAQALLNNPSVQSYLVKGGMNADAINPLALALLQRSATSLPAGTVAALQ